MNLIESENLLCLWDDLHFDRNGDGGVGMSHIWVIRDTLCAHRRADHLVIINRVIIITHPYEWTKWTKHFIHYMCISNQPVQIREGVQVDYWDLPKQWFVEVYP